jgi:hypothetical protein
MRKKIRNIIIINSFFILMFLSYSYSQGNDDIVWVRYIKGDSITYLYNISLYPFSISGENLLLIYDGYHDWNISNPGIIKMDFNGNILKQKEFISDAKHFIWYLFDNDTMSVLSAKSITASQSMYPHIDLLDKNLNSISFISDSTNKIYQYGRTLHYYTKDSIFYFIDGSERDTNGYDYRKNRMFFSDCRSLPTQFIRTDKFDKFWNIWAYFSFEDFLIMNNGYILLTANKSQEFSYVSEESEIFVLDRSGNILSNTPIKFKDKATELVSCTENGDGSIFCFGYTRIKTKYGYETKNDSIFVLNLDDKGNIKFFKELNLRTHHDLRAWKIKSILNNEYFALAGCYRYYTAPNTDSSSYNNLIILDKNGDIKDTNQWKFVDTLQNRIDDVVSYGDRLFIYGTLEDTRNWSERYLYVAEIKYNLTDVNQEYDKGYRADFSISPNPASDYIDINLGRWTPSSRWSPSDLKIFDTLGECVMSVGVIHESIDRRSQLPLHRLNISALSPGLYFISIINGMEKLTGSFIVMK